MSIPPKSYQWVRKGYSESPEDYADRNATVGFIIQIATMCALAATAGFATLAWVTTGVVYALIPIGIFLILASVTALIALIVKVAG
jgi:hypothetical protein